MVHPHAAVAETRHWSDGTYDITAAPLVITSDAAVSASGASSDVDSSLNSSWGESGGDALVRDAAIINRIHQTIPEPATLGLLLLGGLALLRRRFGAL